MLRLTLVFFLLLLTTFWSLPNTVLGLLVALFSLAPPRLRDGVILCSGNRGMAHLLLTRRGFGAITLGRVVVATQRLDLQTWVHELTHLRQQSLWGVVYIPAYLLLQVRYGYENNPFERDAREYAARFVRANPERAREAV